MKEIFSSIERFFIGGHGSLTEAFQYKNCEKYLNDVFSNIKKIQKLFEKTKIIMSFDISNDFTLKKLIELKKKFDIDIIINRDPVTASRTVNIERARNKIINKIYSEYHDYDYFIMIHNVV